MDLTPFTLTAGSAMLFMSVCVGYLVALVQSRKTKESFGIELARAEQSLEFETAQHQLTKAEFESVKSQLHEAQSNYHRAEIQTERAQTEASAAKQMSETLKEREANKVQELQLIRNELESAKQALAKTQSELTELRTSHHERTIKYQEQLALLEQNKVQMTKDFELLANRIFEEKGKSFSQNSQQAMNSMLEPFKEQIKHFRERVESIHTEDTKSQASLAKELEQLRALNQQITDEAHNLTKALKGDNKKQGSWGELQAEMILENSGLSNGVEFFREANFKDEEGKNKRPDLIISLPGGKKVIIDSKVSLVAYVNSVEAEQEEDTNQFLQAHVESVRAHIADLSGKDYTNLNGMNSPDFVLMFMPIEPAFLAAVEHDRTLFNYGFERNVVLVTPTTLLPIVRTIANLWVLERSNEQTREIAEQAAGVFNQLCVFSEKMLKVGNGLRQATKNYNDSIVSLVGQQGLYNKVSKFKDLSVKVSKTLPDHSESLLDVDDEKLRMNLLSEAGVAELDS
ncbi:DNA recombination protein RmuC [Litoribacillus peritrichatus]|uniref:DNA recombination protein RmuC n=1 Tax=Litoribacillus peritrichatus TaxID=718191 RepID=A0ABP7MB76_9GAMM